jgi:glutathione synthase/RimK-type ligase-like ATP-grasp enzyme
MKPKKIKLLVLPSIPNIQQVIDKFSYPVDLTKGKFDDLEIVFKEKQVKILHKGVDLKEFSFVWLSSYWKFRDLAHAIHLYLKQNNIPSAYVEKNTSKLTDHINFSLKNIDSPDTLFMSIKNIKNNLSSIKKVCGYPLIIKDVKGSGGNYSRKVLVEDDLLEKIEELPSNRRYFFQKYIPNEYDWGVMVADGVVVSGEKSYPCTGEFRNNACNGAREVFIDPDKIPDNVKQMAIDASDALNLKWSRSDIIVDKKTKKIFLLEVNRFPGITSKTSEVDGAFTFISSKLESLIV